MKLNGTLLAIAISAAVLATGCFSDRTETDSTEETRGALGKADVYGSCSLDDCGTKSSDGTCWCDEACTGFGDCCSDKAAVCDDACEPVTCEIACSNGFVTDDTGCEICECKPLMCGGFADFACPDDLSCVDDPSDDCHPNNGGADCAGICVDPPAAACGGFLNLPCQEGLDCVDDPSDDCHPNNGGADCSGICVEAKPASCGGFANFPCDDGQLCVDDPSDDCHPDNGGADCSGICIEQQQCGGFADIPCSEGMSCTDDPNDDCDPNNGGADCSGLCVPATPEPEPAVNSCEDHCGTKSEDHSCWCDSACSYWGDCCADVANFCQ